MTPIKSSRKIQATLNGDALITFVAAILLQHARRAASAPPGEPDFMNTKIIPLIQSLRDFVKADKGRLMVVNGVSFASSDEARKISFPVWPSLCDSLLELARTYPQLRSNAVVQDLVVELVSVFNGKTNPRIDGISNPLRDLGRLCAPNEETNSPWFLRQEEMNKVLNDLNLHAVQLSLRGVHKARDRFNALLKRPRSAAGDPETGNCETDDDVKGRR